VNGLNELIPLALQLPSFLLALFRIGGIMIMAPFLGSAAVPAQVKIALTLILTIGLWPILPHGFALPLTLPAMGIAVVAELLIGLAIGLVVTVIFAGLQLAGLAISQQMGISLAEVFNPDFGDSSEVVSMLYYWVGMMIFLAIGGHRLLIGSVLDSFRTVPLGGFAVNEKVMGLLTGAMTASVLMAFKMSLPVVLALFLTSVSMGLINRTVPQLNILTAGFALRTSLGMLLAAATLMAMMKVFLGAIEQALLQLNGAISGWATG